jgi:hypothetical protein
MGLPKPNNYHNALTDARQEAAILKRFFEDFNQGTFVNGKHFKLIE